MDDFPDHLTHLPKLDGKHSALYHFPGGKGSKKRAPLVILALLTGGTLVMDEFDASIHPMALMNIINIFHNDEVNRNGAHLIFNTHNPIFLDATLLRRDEIKFVERDETTGNSMCKARRCMIGIDL